jgi:hypothetical protein
MIRYDCWREGPAAIARKGLTVVLSLSQAEAAGAQVLASNDAITAVYYACPFGEVAVTRTGTYLADEYNAGLVGR